MTTVTITQDTFFIDTDYGRLSTTLVLPTDSNGPHPTVICCHGFAGGKESSKILLLSSELVKHGIATLSFDFHGHGYPPNASDGKIGDFTISHGVNNLRSVIDYACERPEIDTKQLGFYGTSIGANVLLWTLGRYYSAHATQDLGIRSLTLLAPLCDLPNAVIAKAGHKALVFWQLQGYIEESFNDRLVRWKYDVVKDAKTQNTYELAKSIHIPTYIAHGDADDSVPVNQSFRLAEAMGEYATLDIHKDLGHRFLNEEDQQRVIERAVRHHLKYLKFGDTT